MRKRVNLSPWCVILTAVGLIVLFAAAYLAKESFVRGLVIGVIIVLCLTALFFMPLSISVKNNRLYIIRPLKIKAVPLNQIASAELFSPTMAEKRICGSGGWFGYYGWFKEPSVGKYFAYYGKASDCFLLTLKDGKKYVLGCENPKDIVEYINVRLS